MRINENKLNYITGGIDMIIGPPIMSGTIDPPPKKIDPPAM